MTQNLKLDPQNIGEYPDAMIVEGKLYSWREAQTACPSGWGVPSNEEWQALLDAYGGTYSYNRLKFGGDSGFNIYLAGSCYYWTGDNCYGRNKSAFIWSSTGKYNNYHYFYFRGREADVSHQVNYDDTNFFSVRCILDQ